MWSMDPKTDHDWAGAVACCGVDNRGVALAGNMVLSHSLDGRLIATDKDTGKILWQRQVANPDKGEVITAAPLVVKNLVISGTSGAEYGIRGWIAATDLTTQKEVWRTYTIPAKGEAGSETWKDNYDAAAMGGGSTWVTGSYDPKTTLFYGASATPAPTGTRNIVPATISIPTAPWPWISIPVRSSGTISTRRTTHSTMTAWRRMCWSMRRCTAGR